MTVRNRSAARLALLAIAGIAATRSAIVPGAQAQTDSEVVREVEIPEPRGYRRVVVGGSGAEPILVRTMRVRRARLGIALVDITPELRRHFGVSDGDAGVLVSRVTSGSAADAAGIRVGDVLVSVDGRRVSRTYDLVAEIGDREAGEAVVLEGWRDRRLVSFRAELEEAPRSEIDLTPFLDPKAHLRAHPGGPHAPPEDLEEVLSLDPSALYEALRNLERELDSDRLEQHFHRFQESRGGLLHRIEELDRRLRALESELGELPGGED